MAIARDAAAASSTRRSWLRSLRGRLILVVLGMIAVVVTSVQVAWERSMDSWLSDHVREYHKLVSNEVLNYVYTSDVEGPLRGDEGLDAVRRILRFDLGVLRRYFKDVLISNGPSPDVPGSVDLNPMGALGRDPATFPLDEIRAGIRRAMTTGLEFVGGGFCQPIVSRGEVVGGAWYEPVIPEPPGLPLSAYLAPIVIGGLVFGAGAYWLIERGVVKPLRDVGQAAESVGAREHGVRVPHIAGTYELDPFIDAFNRMAERVDGHRSELEREVALATETAERRQEAMLRSARLASMGTLAAGIAHEINNPIGGMLNAVRRIGENESLDERDRRYIELIQEGLERVAHIARRVLDFSPRELEAKPFSIAQVVEAARGLADHRFRQQSVELRVALPGALPALVGDAHEFQQVLLNIFINSLDVLEGREDPCWISIGARTEPGWLVLEIEDNGPGMAKADLAMVMDPFYSGKGRPDSSGLGMFISHQIIENHGGVLEVDAELGVGFRVMIRMPV